MWKWLSATLFVILLSLVLLDRFLTPSTLISTYHLVDQHTLEYVVPRSGAATARCQISAAQAQQIAGQPQVTIKLSAIFERCLELQALSAEEQTCRQTQIRQLIAQAHHYHEQQQLSYAQASYSLACQGQIDLPEALQACELSLKLAKTLEQDRQALLSYLDSHQQKYQAYPAQLSELKNSLPPLLQERQTNFSYCRKNPASANTATCSDGAVSYADAAIVLYPKYLSNKVSSGWSPDQDQKLCVQFEDNRKK